MPFFVTGSAALLSISIEDGNESVYPRAFVWRNGTQETAISLVHAGFGRYVGVWIPSQQTKYNVLYRVYDDEARTIPASEYAQSEETWQSVDGAIAPVVASQVWDEALVGHATLGSAGEYLIRVALIEKLLRNRLELSEGDTANWVLYDDDSVTPLLTWNVTDKNGDLIRINSFVPAKRSRGG